MSNLKAAVIGLGVGEAHAEAYQNSPYCELAAICDFNPKVLETKGARFAGIPIRTTDPLEILKHKQIQVVSIASYDNHHFDQIKVGLEHNKHLFVEKPICVKRKNADKIYGLIILLHGFPELSYSWRKIIWYANR